MQPATPSKVTQISISLDDKWTRQRGRIFINGTQALARVRLAQKQLDEAAGLNTAGYISGYRGSPLGNVDNTLWSISKRLDAAKILFVPGVNEDTRDRRMERIAITDYEALISEILELLSAANIEAAVQLADLTSIVRGYGPVKATAAKAYAAALPAAREAFIKVDSKPSIVA